MGDIIIRYINMEHTVPAVTQIDSNGDYNVYINARLGYRRQQEAKEHELNHINGDHFYRDTPVSQDEQEAENKPVKVTPVQVKPVVPDFRQLRISTGLSAYQLSKIVGISTGRYVRIEHGLSTPTPDELESIEKFYSNKGAGI